MKNSYSLAVVCAGIVFGLAAAPCALTAQAEGQAGIQMVATQPAPVAVSDGVAASAVGPVVAPVAFHTAPTQSMVVADQDTGPHLGTGLAMTAVGIVAVAVGFAVKGGAGTAIALGGGALALYGLYHWIQ